MPLLLYTYLATEILAPFFASFLIINAILFLGRLAPLFNLLISFGVGAGDFLRFAAYLLPKLLLFSVPMAGMTAVVVAITRMVNDKEIMALKTAGLGLVRLLPPVACLALVLSLGAWFSTISLIPQSSLAMKSLFLQLAREKIDQGLTPGQFSEGLGKVVVYLEAMAPESKEWRGVYLNDLRHGAEPLTVVAKSGRLAARPEEMTLELILTDGSMHQSKGDLSQTIHFDSYRLSLPFRLPAATESTAGGIGKSGLSQSELLAEAKRLGPESDKGLSLLVEYHSRLALPAGGLILTILGLPLAMLSRPGGRAVGLPLALFFFVLYYLFFTAGRGLTESGHLPPIMGIWLADFLLALITLALIRQAAMETTPLWFSRIENRLRSLPTVFDRFRLRRKK